MLHSTHMSITIIGPISIVRDWRIGAELRGQPEGNDLLLKDLIDRDLTFPANLAGSVAKAETLPTASYAMDVRDDGAAFATITIDAAGAVTMATTGGLPIDVAAGSVLTITGQAGLDATVANVLIKLLAAYAFPEI